MQPFRFTARDLAKSAGQSPDEPYAVALARGTLELGYYSPVSVDLQEPHDQDEVYVIVSGSGTFVRDGEESEFGPGDALFVPAGVEHRFIDFSDDTEMWVVFYGREGGVADGDG